MRKLLLLGIGLIGSLSAFAQLPNGSYTVPHSHSLDKNGKDISDQFPWEKILLVSTNMDFGFGEWSSIVFCYSGGFPQGPYMRDYKYKGSTNIDGEIFYQYVQNNMFMGDSYVLVNRDASRVLVKESMGGRTNVFLK